MPIPEHMLRAAAGRRANLSRSIAEAKRTKPSAFLSHSHADRELAVGLQVLLIEHGWDVYLDWQDGAMPAKPTKVTASRIKQKIAENDWFIFFATTRSQASRWCPWEIGFADRAKGTGKILLVQTTTSAGSEYLQLYRSIAQTTDNDLAVFDPGRTDGGIALQRF